jgi:hypothetical protein
MESRKGLEESVSAQENGKRGHSPIRWVDDRRTKEYHKRGQNEFLGWMAKGVRTISLRSPLCSKMKGVRTITRIDRQSIQDFRWSPCGSASGSRSFRLVFDSENLQEIRG